MTVNNQVKTGLQAKILISLAVAGVLPFGILAAVAGIGVFQSIGGIVAIVSLLMGLMIAWGICQGIVKQTENIDLRYNASTVATLKLASM